MPPYPVFGWVFTGTEIGPAPPDTARRGGGEWSALHPRFTAVGAERPQAVLRVADHEVAGPVVGVVRLLDDARPRGGRPGEQRVRVVGHDVRAERAGGEVPLVVRRLADAAQHDPAAGWPGELGVADPV